MSPVGVRYYVDGKLKRPQCKTWRILKTTFVLLEVPVRSSFIRLIRFAAIVAE